MKKQPIKLSPTRGGREFLLTPTEGAFQSLWRAIGEMEAAVPSQRIFRVVIFGSARALPDDPDYREMRMATHKMAERGIIVATGGGPGLMSAANEGAKEGGKKHPQISSVGVCIQNLNREDRPNAFLEEEFSHRHFLTRLHQLARFGANGAFVIAGGGVGTDLERALILQLLQVGHLKGPILIAVGEMWQEYIDWAKKWMVPRFANARDLEYMKLVPTMTAALPIIFGAHARFKRRRATG